MYKSKYGYEKPIKITEQMLAQKLGISDQFARYILKHSDKNHYDPEQYYQSMEQKIKKIEQLFKKYQIDGLIQHKNNEEDSYTKFFKDVKIEKESDTILQLYITQKFGAKKKLQFDKQEFLFGMIRLDCSTIADLKKLIPTIREKIVKKNLYKKLYVYYFKVYSEQKNTISFSNALFLWDFLLKDQFQEISEFVQYYKSKQNLQTNQISFDAWCQVWKFFETIGNDYSKFDENDAWPAIIYEFVMWKRK